MPFQLISLLVSLNPYSGGRYILRKSREGRTGDIECLNPYSGGRYILSEFKDHLGVSSLQSS